MILKDRISIRNKIAKLMILSKDKAANAENERAAAEAKARELMIENDISELEVAIAELCLRFNPHEIYMEVTSQLYNMRESVPKESEKKRRKRRTPEEIAKEKAEKEARRAEKLAQKEEEKRRYERIREREKNHGYYSPIVAYLIEQMAKAPTYENYLALKSEFDQIIQKYLESESVPSSSYSYREIPNRAEAFMASHREQLESFQSQWGSYRI